MNNTIKRGWEIQLNLVAILLLMSALWRIMTDVKYLFTTPSYEISKIDVMVSIALA